jgi:hypothetical protein
MIEVGLERGLLVPGKTIIDSTSGNTASRSPWSAPRSATRSSS